LVSTTCIAGPVAVSVAFVFLIIFSFLIACGYGPALATLGEVVEVYEGLPVELNSSESSLDAPSMIAYT
jgi:hypothetical protein